MSMQVPCHAWVAWQACQGSCTWSWTRSPPWSPPPSPYSPCCITAHSHAHPPLLAVLAAPPYPACCVLLQGDCQARAALSDARQSRSGTGLVSGCHHVRQQVGHLGEGLVGSDPPSACVPHCMGVVRRASMACRPCSSTGQQRAGSAAAWSVPMDDIGKRWRGHWGGAWIRGEHHELAGLAQLRLVMQRWQ